MKDMIGDIKRDPSLLYRLSSLPGGGGDFATSNTATMGETTTYLHSNALHATDNSNSNNPINYNGANVGMITPSSANANSFNNSSISITNNNSQRASFNIDDDHTEVSSLGMMSSEDYSRRDYYKQMQAQQMVLAQQQFGRGDGGGGGGQQPPMQQSSYGNNYNKTGSAAPQAGEPSFQQESQAASTAIAIRRTSHDAEIALRMQSLRAKRGLTSPPTQHHHKQQNHQRPQQYHHHRQQQQQRLPVPLKSSVPNANGPAPTTSVSASAPNSQQQRLERKPSKDAGNATLERKSSKDAGNTTIERKSSEDAGSTTLERKTSSSGKEMPPPPPSLDRKSGSGNQQEKKSRKSSSSNRRSSSGASDDDSQNSVALVLYQGEDADGTDVSAGDGKMNALTPVNTRGAQDYYSMPYSAMEALAIVPDEGRRANSENHYHSGISKYGDDENNEGDVQHSRHGSSSRSLLQEYSSSSSSRRDVSSERSVRRGTSSNSRRVVSTDRSLRRENSSSSRRPASERRDSADSSRSNSKTMERKDSGGSERRRSQSARPSPEKRETRSSKYESTRGSSRSNHPSSSASYAQYSTRKSSHAVATKSEFEENLQMLAAPLDRDSLIESLRAEQQQSGSLSIQHDHQPQEERYSKKKSKKDRKESSSSSRDLVEKTSTSKKGRSDGRSKNKKDMSEDRAEEEEKVDRVSSLPSHSFESTGDFSEDFYQSTTDITGSMEGSEGGLSQLHKLARRRSFEGSQDAGSQSGRSVISRLTQLQRRVKNKTPKKNSGDSCSQSVRSNSHSLVDVHSIASFDPYDPNNSSPKRSNESDNGSVSQKVGRGRLISRLSHMGGMASPSHTRRRTTTVELDGHNLSLAASDWDKTTTRSAGNFETPFMTNEENDAMAMSRELTFATGEVARLCDEKGRCILHPHIR